MARAPRDRGRIASVAVGVALAALILGAIAASGAKLKTSSATTIVESGESGSATAKCKQGTKAVSGGYVTPPDTPDGLGAEAHESRRVGSKKWTTSTYNSGTGENLTSFAYCRDEAIRVATAQVGIAAQQPGFPPLLDTGSATAKCPRGTKVVSGGFDNPDFDFQGGSTGTNIRPYEMRKVGKRRWKVSASNRSNNAGTLVAYAYCHDGKALKTKRVSKSLVLKPGAPRATAIARCKRSQRAVSGGFSSAQPADFGGPFVTESRRKGKRKWVVSAFSNEVGPAITAYAYCEKKGQN
jgi:hypothetical protein